MSVVEEAQQSGQFDETEGRMIQALVGFRDTTVEQIMTPRTEVEALELTNNLGEVIRFIKQSRHSRIPVYEESLDHVVGMFYVKDLMRWLAGDGVRQSGKPFELKSILRPAYFVPETKTIRELLQELINKKVHAAMVADEYGGTSGLVSLEDIVEEIFGEIQDEYELAEDDAPELDVREDQRDATIDARAYIDDANEALAAIGLKLPEGEDYDTVGGLVITTMGRIPLAGETLLLEGEEAAVAITVLDAEPTKVLKVRVQRGAAEPGPTPDAPSQPTAQHTPDPVVVTKSTEPAERA
jgi:putative hemolysin